MKLLGTYWTVDSVARTHSNNILSHCSCLEGKCVEFGRLTVPHRFDQWAWLVQHLLTNKKEKNITQVDKHYIQQILPFATCPLRKSNPTWAVYDFNTCRNLSDCDQPDSLYPPEKRSGGYFHRRRAMSETSEED